MFSKYPREICSGLFLKGNGRGTDLLVWERGGGARGWEKWRENYSQGVMHETGIKEKIKDDKYGFTHL